MTKITSTFGGIALGPNASGTFNIGGTNDILYGGDMSGDAAGMGIPLIGTGCSQQFALAVYGDDGGTAVASGWVSAGFFSYVNHAAQAAGSAMGVTGQVHIGANFTAGDNIAGVYGLTECDSAQTVNAHVYGGQFGLVLSAGTYAAEYRTAAISLSVNTAGATTNGVVSGIFFGNAATGMDAAFCFGNPGGNMTGTGADATASTGTDALGHILVYLNDTLGYINVVSDIS